MEPSISVPANKKYNGFLNILCFYQDELVERREMFGGERGGKKKKTGHNPFFNTKSLGSNRITVELQARPLKNMFLFKMILIQSRIHYVFFTRSSSKLFTYLVHLGNVGKYSNNYIF